MSELLRKLPGDTGMAYVVVMHLSPDYPSALPEILQRETPMQVHQVTDGIKVDPDNVYVIPPNRNLKSIDSHLHLEGLEERRRDRAQIDFFFRTLSDSHQEKAVGVLLSGTGTDGTVGMGYIRERGGICLVQEPMDAEHGDMPQSAIAHGVTDRALPVGEMAEHLARIAQSRTQIELPEDVNELSADAQRLLQKIHAQVRVRTSRDFTRYKGSTIIRRIRRRMQLSNQPSLEGYVQYLREEPEEVARLADDMLITVTNFFRDAAVFRYLEEEVLPGILAQKSNAENIRVWSVGCASGEEAYSLAMLLLEASDKLDHPPVFQVFASDLHDASLARGRDGFYPESIESDVSPERLRRFFRQESGGYRIRNEVRELVVFAPHNLLKDPPFSRIDLVCCRNLLIYLQRDVQQDIIELFHYALRAEGMMLLGSSETVDDAELFHCVHKEHKVYARRNSRATEPRMPLPSFSQLVQRRGRENNREAGRTSYGTLHQKMVERYGPPSVLINREHNIVHYSANAGRYMVQPGGDPTNNIFKRVVEELRVELRSAVYAAEQGENEVRTRAIQIKNESPEGGKSVVARVQAPQDAELEGYILILFDESHLQPLPPQKPQLDRRNASVQELEGELDLTQRRLQMVIQEYESTQDQMRASNEELQSANEELRSTMEELETSKEELQSMNEELITVNQENRHKVDELSMLTSDLQNLLASTDIATLFLDRELRILRYTPRVSELFSVRASDRGRPLRDFTHRLGYDGLHQDAAKVLETLQPIQREVASDDGVWYLLRILPYRTAEDRVEGVVITLVEISLLKETELRLRKREQELEQVTATLEERVEEATATVRRLASNLALAEQQERDRIARILHDDLQQMLASVQMRLHILESHHNLPEENTRELVDELRTAIDMTRCLTVDLSPPILHQEGFPEVLRWMSSRIEEQHGLSVRLEIAEGFSPLRREAQVLLFQVVRELLFNVVKHANTDEACVALSSEDSWLRIEVADEGDGFEADEAVEDGTGFGLGSVRERIQLFGGEVAVYSRPGDGTRVTIILPLESTT
ncbi:MAG: two-component system chemotaxis family CheB/CheR fusion protein [Puniceicoccaceae bacterium 5H]|nr:MAG: two-component system chemotaxis family CheB/CheR fusion protein [Puniceicoccaceae bacterium 5H]